MNKPKILFDLHSSKKSETSPIIMKSSFNELKSNYTNCTPIYTDGSKDNMRVGCAVISDNYSENMIRLEEVVLARIRIGHTRITHSYRLNREEQPQFVGCDKPFTVRHILLECVDFSNVRNKYYHVNTIKQLFNDVPIDKVFLFLKEINLFNKL